MTGLIAVLFTFAFMLGACMEESGQPGSGSGTQTVKTPDAAVTGTVTYRERLALTDGARLIVELRDVSLADAAAPLIASQTIENPGQVPIGFRVEYDSKDINPRNTYSVSARIVERDGRLAFTNDTAYEVITRGNPSRVDMLLVLVQPPPEAVEEGKDWRTWVETPARIARANLMRSEREPLIRVHYYQSTIEGCARRGNESLELEGTDFMVSVTLIQPPSTPWAIPCEDEVVELDAVFPLEEALKPGQTYRVVVNGWPFAAFTVPDEEFHISAIAESHILRAGVEEVEEEPANYELTVVSSRPVGSSCSRFDGYETRRQQDRRIDVSITHHQVTASGIACTKDVPLDETIVPLGSYFEAGEEYEVVVNSDTTVSFLAR